MADKLTFSLDLTGDMANALRGVIAQLDAADKGMGKARTSANGLDAELQKLSAGARPLLKLEWGNLVHSFAGFRREADGGWVFNLAEGMHSFASAAMRAATTMGHLVVQIGRAVAGEQDLALAERLNVGDGGSAMLKQIGDDFGATKFDDGEVRRVLLPFVRAGIRDRNTLFDLATMASDIDALTGGETSFAEAGAALAKINIKREFGERQLEALGLNATDAYAALAARLGRTVEDTKKRANAGQIAGEDLIAVVREQVAAAQGGTLGTASEAAGSTLGASFRRLSNLPENLFKLADGTPAMQSFQKALDDFVKLMQGPTGASVMESLAKALRMFVDAMGGVAKYIAEKVATTNAYDRLKDQGGVTGAIAHVPFLRLVLGGTDAYQNTIREEMAKVGVAAGDGVNQGMTESLAGVGANAGATIVADFAGPKGIDAHSPSRKFMELGRYAAEGFEAGMGDIAGPDMTLDVAARSSRQTITAQAAGHTFNFYVTGGDSEAIVDKLTHKVEAILSGHYARVVAEAS